MTKKVILNIFLAMVFFGVIFFSHFMLWFLADNIFVWIVVVSLTVFLCGLAMKRHLIVGIVLVVLVFILSWLTLNSIRESFCYGRRASGGSFGETVQRVFRENC